jgi:hypothetical protein
MVEAIVEEKVVVEMLIEGNSGWGGTLKKLLVRLLGGK